MFHLIVLTLKNIFYYLKSKVNKVLI